MKCTMYLVMDMVQGQSMAQMLEEKRESRGFDNEIMNVNNKKERAARFTEEECKYVFT